MKRKNSQLDKDAMAVKIRAIFPLAAAWWKIDETSNKQDNEGNELELQNICQTRGKKSCCSLWQRLLHQKQWKVHQKANIKGEKSCATMDKKLANDFFMVENELFSI